MSSNDPENLAIKKRHFIVVRNNPEQCDYDALPKLYDTGIVQYILCAKENFDIEGKTPHLHIYIQFKNCSRSGYYLKKFWDKAKILWCVGTADSNRNYALGIGKTAEEHGKPLAKDDDISEWGTFKPNSQGRKFAGVKRKLDDGYTLGQVSQEHFGLYCRYRRAFKSYKMDNIPRRRWKTEVFILYGPGGTGKSQFFWDRYPDGNAMEYRNSFWSDYNGEEAVLWDDFNPQTIDREHFLKLCDRYPMKIRQIGGWCEWSPKVIYISSNYDPQYWYGHNDISVQRRISNVITFDSDGAVENCTITPVTLSRPVQPYEGAEEE